MRMNNEQLNELKEKLYSGLICDVLDYFGYRNQSLTSCFAPARSDMTVFG